jgi:hypothetical protein
MDSETPRKTGCAAPSSKLSFTVPIPLERMEVVVHTTNATYPESMTDHNGLHRDIIVERPQGDWLSHKQDHTNTDDDGESVT